MNFHKVNAESIEKSCIIIAKKYKNPTDPQMLSFVEGEIFIVIQQADKKQVVNNKGQVGFVLSEDVTVYEIQHHKYAALIERFLSTVENVLVQTEEENKVIKHLKDLKLQAEASSKSKDATVLSEKMKNRSQYELFSVLLALEQLTPDTQQDGSTSPQNDVELVRIVSKNLQQINTALNNVGVENSQKILKTERYKYVKSLVSHYKMMTSWEIRQPLIQAFDKMCTLDRGAVTVLCWSELPLEIAKDMLANATLADHLTVSAKHLTTMFSMGDLLPHRHFEQFIEINFVSFLLKLIETSPETNTDDNIPDPFLNLLLAFNLQFKQPKNNTILDALELKEREYKIFTKKLLLLLKTHVDPVKVLDHQSDAPHSVQKLLLDCFIRSSTAFLFSTNDTESLLKDILVEVPNHSEGDELRRFNLQLCLGILRHTDCIHYHYQTALRKCLEPILSENEDGTRSDIDIVEQIFKCSLLNA